MFTTCQHKKTDDQKDHRFSYFFQAKINACAFLRQKLSIFFFLYGDEQLVLDDHS